MDQNRPFCQRGVTHHFGCKASEFILNQCLSPEDPTLAHVWIYLLLNPSVAAKVIV